MQILVANSRQATIGRGPCLRLLRFRGGSHTEFADARQRALAFSLDFLPLLSGPTPWMEKAPAAGRPRIRVGILSGSVFLGHTRKMNAAWLQAKIYLHGSAILLMYTSFNPASRMLIHR